MSSLRMMKDGDEADINVSWEDQNKINTFSKLNSKLYMLEEQYEAKKLEKEYLDDAISELELADEDDIVKYRVGTTFVNAPYSEVQQWLERDQAAMEGQVTKLKDQMGSIAAQMEGLKTALYSRFGNSINLERE